MLNTHLSIKFDLFLTIVLLNTQVYDILKGTILKSYKELEKQRLSRFVKDMTPENVDLVEFIQDTITNR